MVIIRENTEDLYCGKPEVWVDEDTCEATKRITRGGKSITVNCKGDGVYVKNI